MVKFGAFIFPNVLTWTRIKPRIFSETPLPSRNVASRQDLGSIGYIVELEGIITGTRQEVKDKIIEMENLSDGTTKLFDFEKEAPTFHALMLEPIFERVRGFSNFVRYRVRIVQVSVVVVAVEEMFILDIGRLDINFLG